MLGTWQLELSLQIALAAVPVAVYFLVLGLLNSQPRPQLLSSRLDFILLMAAFSPLCIVPLLTWIGVNLLTVAVAVGAVAAVIMLLAPRKHQGWVIYNISLEKALRSAQRAMDVAGIAYARRGDVLQLDDGPEIRLSAFPLLRNVAMSVHDEGGGSEVRSVLQRFEAEVARRVGRIEVTPSPTAVTFVLISTAMIVTPLVLMAERMPEMVRIINDMIR